MSEIINNNEWAEYDKAKIEQKNKIDAEQVLQNTPKRLADELGTNYTLDCWVEEDKCRNLWIEWIEDKAEKIWVNISWLKELLWQIHKWEDISLSENQKDIAKELIKVIASQKWETLESVIAKSAWTEHDTEDDKLNHALNVAILNLNTK